MFIVFGCLCPKITVIIFDLYSKDEIKADSNDYEIY